MPGLHVYTDGSLWNVITGYDTNIWGDPYAIPSLVRLAHVPGVIAPWQQPIDQFDSYLLPDPFTGVGMMCSHNGKNWRTTVNFNVWQPDAVGSESLWEEIE